MSNWPDIQVVPLHSHITGKLWVGGCPVESAPRRFRHIFDLYGQQRYYVDPDTHREVIQTLDRPKMPGNDASIWWLAQAIWIAMQDKHGDTLVHCNAGLNRSGLFAAAALMVGGMTAEQAIALLRQKRSGEVLHNRTFENWLLTARVQR